MSTVPALSDCDRVARWYDVEALVTRAQRKGVDRIDTDLVAQALGLDQPPAPATGCRAPGSPSCACNSGEYRFCGADLGRDEPPHTCNRRVAHTGACSPDPDPDPADDFGQTPGEYVISTRPADGTPTEDGRHNFTPEYLGIADAKRRLPKYSECRQPATDPAHDDDQSEDTRRLRMLLNAVKPAPAADAPAADAPAVDRALLLRVTADLKDTADRTWPKGDSTMHADVAALRGWADSLTDSAPAATPTNVPALLAELQQLREQLAEQEPRIALLNALDVAGVDNWEGYDEARELLDS